MWALYLHCVSPVGPEASFSDCNIQRTGTKPIKGAIQFSRNPGFCSAIHVWSRLQCVHTSTLPRVPLLWFRYCDHRQPGWWPWAPCALEKRGQWLHLFPIQRDYRLWRPWLITQRQTSEYGQGKVQLFNSSHTQSIQTSCWRSFPSSRGSFFSVTIAFHRLSLHMYGSHNYLATQSCCNCGGAWTLLSVLFLLEMSSFLLCESMVNWLC